MGRRGCGRSPVSGVQRCEFNVRPPCWGSVGICGANAASEQPRQHDRGDILSGDPRPSVAILRTHELPFEVRTGTSEEREGGTDRPDFVLADAALFVGVFGEVKKSDVSIGEISESTDRDNQIGRYLARTGVVLVSNVRGFGLLTCAPSFDRSLGTPVPPEERDLIGEVDLWAQATGSGTRTRVDVQAVEELGRRSLPVRSRILRQLPIRPILQRCWRVRLATPRIVCRMTFAL